MFSTFEKQRGVYKLAYQSYYKHVYVSLHIQILLMVFLQILIITHTDRDMSHFAREGIFNQGLGLTDLGS